MQCVQSDCKVHVYTWDSFRENVYNNYYYNVIKMHRIGITITFEYFQKHIHLQLYVSTVPTLQGLIPHGFKTAIS